MNRLRHDLWLHDVASTAVHFAFLHRATDRETEEPELQKTIAESSRESMIAHCHIASGYTK